MHCGPLVLLLSVALLRSCKAQAAACTNFDLRLRSGSQPSEGRVEMCRNGGWGTVCDDSWDNNDAAVVCRQLGYRAEGATSSGQATYGPGTGPILLDDVVCRGTEDRLIDCSSRTLGSHNCGHNEDAGVQCRVCIDGDVRLEGGSTEREGRVEVCSSGQWGTVCDDFWNTPDATVVCRQLGFSKFGAVPTFRASFGVGVGAIVLDDVRCVGNEISIFNCSRATVENCNHFEDAGVRCAPLVCHDGDLRLVGGTTPDQGRLEVCMGEVWGTVCDDSFGVVDANVVCRQLNYSSFTARVYVDDRFGPGTGPIFVDNANCVGSEQRLVDCPYDRHTLDCNHNEDIGIWCQTNVVCNTGDIRLVNGNNEMEGRIEVCLNNAWGTVCDDSWSVEDSNVACGQLGFSTSGSTAFKLAFFGQGTLPINMDDVQCTGSEARLSDCPFDRHTSDCRHHEDAGVRCQPRSCSNGDVRLVNGASENEGRVEMCWNEEWGTVCDDLWGPPEANVVCRQLGYNSPSNTNVAYSRALFGEGSGSILLDDVRCEGNELTLISCPRQMVGTHNCGHHEDAGVRCGECVENSVRLSGGRVPHEGRVEVCLSGRWGMVCDDGWSGNDARVVCRQLGFSQNGAQVLYRTTFGGPILPFVMDNVRCTGWESALTDCNYLGATQIRSCSTSEDAGLRCRPSLPGPPASIFVTSNLSVTWTPPISLPRSSPILRYNVSCSPIISVGPTLMLVSLDNSTLSTSFVGAVPNTLYSCCAAAINAAGKGEARCSTVRTSEAPPTAAPRSVNVNAISSTALTISWNTPPSQSTNGRIRNYHYHVTESETGTVRDGFTLSRTVTVTGLHPYYNYQCKVAAVTVGQGPYSSPVTVRTFTAVPSSAPYNVNTTTLSPTSFSLTWSLPVNTSHNGPLTGYTIRVVDAIRYGVTMVTGNGSSLSTHIVTGLHPYTPYICTIAMSNANGTGPFSQSVIIETSETVPTAAPRSVRAGTPSTTSLRLTWSPPPPDQQNGEIRHYSIRVTGTDTDVSTTATGLSITVPSLHPYYIYQYSVAAVTVGTGPYSVPDTVRMPPDVPSGHPTNFRSTQVTATSVALAWSAPPTDQHNGVITNYDVRVTREGFPPTFMMTTSNLLETTINFLVPFTTYFFVVAARTVVGRGPFSTELTIITNASLMGPSAPPNNLAINALSATSLRLMWEAPAAEHRNGVITKYVIEVTEQDTGVEIQRNTSSLSLMLSLLHPYYTYRCRVAAFTIALGPFTETVSKRTLPDVPSGYPQNIVATVLSPSSISLSWQPLLLSERNGVITIYSIDFTDIEAGTHTSHTTTALSLLLPARPYTSYSLFVAASTEVGLGPYSVATTIRTPESAPTHVPRSISYEILGATSFLLRWLPPPEEHHHGIIREYRANAVEETSGRVFTLTTPGNTTEVVFENLHPFYLYNCTVAAITVDLGPFSATIGAMTNEAAPGASPQNIRALPLSSTSFSITWEEVPEDQKNGIIRRYDVVVSSQAGEVLQNIFLSESRRSVNVTNLEEHTIYRCRVRARTVAPGPYSTEIQVQTPEDIPSGPPERLTAITSDSRTLVLSWQPPAERERNGVILTYTINITDVLSGATSLFTTSATTYTVNNLHPYYVYHCSVAASTQEGRGPFTYRVPVEMPEAAPSSAPRDVSAEVLGSTLARLTWSAPLPVDQNGMIRQYHISVTEMDTRREFTLISESQQYDLDFLLPHHTYQFSIAAVTVAAGPFSIPLTFVTAEEAPGTPRDLTITTINSRSLVLTWEAPLETNGVITGYIIFCNSTGQDVGHSSGTRSISTSTQLGFLHPYYSYLCNVAAETSVGRGPPAYKGVQMPQDVPTAPPRELAGEPAHSRELRLSWIAPEITEQNGILTFYLLGCLEVETGEMLNETISAINRFAILHSLHPNYRYRCLVAATTVVGAGPYSSVLEIQMPEDAPTGTPLDFTKASLNPLFLTWQAPSIGNQNGALTGYTLRVSEGARDNVYMLETLSPSYTNASLLKFTNYTFAVAAKTAMGIGPFTDPIAVTTPAGVPSVSPSVGMVTRISATAIRISWEPLSRKQSQGIVNEYLIKYRPTDLNGRGKRNVDDLAVVVIVPGTNTEYTLEGLDQRRQYAIAVAASTSAGHGNYSEEHFIGFFDNMLFQLHLTSEAVLCREWLIDGITDKERDIADGFTKQLSLEKNCNCDITNAYIAETRLICNEATHKSIVFRGRMITTPTHTSTELLTELQDWVDTEPLLTIRGIQFRVLPCRVKVTEPDNLECILFDVTPTKSKHPSKIPEKTPHKGDLEETGGGGGGGGVPIPIVAGAAIGGVVLVFIIIIVIVAIVVVRRKRRKQHAVRLGPDLRLNITPDEHWTGGVDREPDLKAAIAESDFHLCADDDHFYDSIPADYKHYKKEYSGNGAEAPPSYHTAMHHAHNPLATRPSCEEAPDYAQLNAGTLLEDSPYHHLRRNPSDTSMLNPYDPLPYHPPGYAVPRPVEYPSRPPEQGSGGLMEEMTKGGAEGVGFPVHQLEQDDYVEMKSHSP